MSKPLPTLPPMRDPIVMPTGEMPTQWRRWFEETQRKLEDFEARLKALEP